MRAYAMKTRMMVLAAVMLLATLAPLVPTEAAAAPDRPPIINAGPDQTVEESQSPCNQSASGSSTIPPCNFVIIDAKFSANDQCDPTPIHGLTYDPDCQGLKYAFRRTPDPCNPDPTTGSPAGGVPCIPIGDGSKFVDRVNNPFSPDYLSSSSVVFPVSIPSSTVGCPNILIAKGGDLGVFTFPVPNIPAGQGDRCIYSLDMMATDSQTPPTQPTPPPAAAGKTDYTLDVDTVVITVVPAQQAPKIQKVKLVVSICDKTVEDTSKVCSKAVSSTDIVSDHGRYLQFTYGHMPDPTANPPAPAAGTAAKDYVVDDLETRAVQLTFHTPCNVCKPDLEHHFIVPLTTKLLAQQYSASPPVEEWSTWLGNLPIDTPSLIAGVYQVDSVVYDGEGGHSTSLTPDDHLLDFEVTSAIGADGVPTAPCNPVGSGHAPCYVADDGARTEVRFHACFPDAGATLPARALGHGEVVRPQVFWATLGPNDPTVTPAIYDAGLFGWKVTYQSCIKDSKTGFRALGEEVDLPKPYFLSLDTLSGEQEVAIRMYDRIGNDVQSIVIPIVKDTDKPDFYDNNPLVTYQGIPFQLVMYVHDFTDTAVTLHIETFNKTLQGKVVHYDNVLVAGGTNFNGTVTSLPRLGNMTAYDLFGAHDLKSTCDYLYDADGDSAHILDHYYNPVNHTSGLLVYGDTQIGATNWYADTNKNGQPDNGEPMVVGDLPNHVKDHDKCLNAFVEDPYLQFYLGNGTTQVFAFNLTRYLLGNTTYQFTIQDLVFNRFSDATASLQIEGVGLPHTSSLFGHLETQHAKVDARILDVSVARGNYLAGDLVKVYVNATQIAQLGPNVRPQDAPVVPLTFDISDISSPSECSSPTSLDQHLCLRICPIDGCAATSVRSGEVVKKVFDRPITFYRNRNALLTQDLVATAAQPYTPGSHTVNAKVRVDPHVTDSLLANNEKAATFEIYLGEVVVGAYPAHGQPSGRVFLIKANLQRLPQTLAGAIEVDASGAVKASHDMVLNQTGGPPRYEFTYTDDAGKQQTAAWEPQTRFSRVFGKDCSKLTDVEKTVDLAANPPLDPQCRFITVVAPKGNVPAAGKKSPGPELVLVLLAIAAMVALLRRRR